MTGRAENRKYHYFYKITNNTNNHYYYGVHNTDNLDDGYMGSGKRLQYAYKKYGIENFTKEILKMFPTSEEAFSYEAEVVTEELVKDDTCYNCELGGVFIDTTGFVPVKDKDGNRFLVDVEDERYKNGEFVGVTKGTVCVLNEHGSGLRVSVNDERYLSGELKPVCKGKTVVKDNHGNFFMVSVDDERLKTGELKPTWSGRKHNEKTIEKMRKNHEIHHYQTGKKNSQFGTCWINNSTENKKIKKEDLSDYLKSGWVKGRLISKDQIDFMHRNIKKYGGKDTVWISNEKEQKSTYVPREKVGEFLECGWVLGRKFYNRN